MPRDTVEITSVSTTWIALNNDLLRENSIILSPPVVGHKLVAWVKDTWLELGTVTETIQTVVPGAIFFRVTTDRMPIKTRFQLHPRLTTNL